MNNTKTFFFSLVLLVLALQELQAAQNGNESGQNIRRNEYEYNLYDRNYDRLRGRGVYDDEEVAYPNEYDYIQESDRRQSTDRRHTNDNRRFWAPR